MPTHSLSDNCCTTAKSPCRINVAMVLSAQHKGSYEPHKCCCVITMIYCSCFSSSAYEHKSWLHFASLINSSEYLWTHAGKVRRNLSSLKVQQSESDNIYRNISTFRELSLLIQMLIIPFYLYITFIHLRFRITLQ